MILLVVSISTAVYAYTTNGLGSYGSNFSNLLSNQGNSISQQISIEQATFNLTSNSQAGADIYVRNTGTVPLTIASVYVQNVTSNSFVLAYSVSPQVNVQTGNFARIGIHFTPDAQATYQFMVVTTLGTSQIASFPA
jgi:hypothetical protein